MSAIMERLSPWRKGAQESLDASQRVQLEGNVTEIVQRQEFGENEFNQFAINMILLTKNPKGRDPTGRIIDEKEKKLIYLLKFTEGIYTIVVLKGGESIENADENLHGTVLEFLSYRQDAETKKRMPHLKSCFTAVVPLSIQYDSYFTGESDYVSQPGHMLEREQFLPDDKVRTFCQRVFELYQESQVAKQASTTASK